MASPESSRHPVIYEALQQLVGAIRVLQKMIGSSDDSWVVESAQVATDSSPSSAKTVYISAAKNLHDTATKFTLIFKDAKTPDQVGTFAETMERALVGLVQSSQTLLKTSGVHELLAAQVNLLLNDTLDVTSKLAHSMSLTLDLKSAPRMTGQIWANCEALEKLDLDMSLKQFVERCAKAQLVSIKDALEELNEEMENDDDDDEEEEDDDFGKTTKDETGDDVEILDMTLKKAEKKIVPGCLIALKTASSYCTQIHKVTELIQEDEESRKVLLKIYEKLKSITAIVDDFNSAIYPPQKSNEVIDNANKLKQTLVDITLLLTSLPQLSAHHTKLIQLQTTAAGLFDKAESQIKNP